MVRLRNIFALSAILTAWYDVTKIERIYFVVVSSAITKFQTLIESAQYLCPIFKQNLNPPTDSLKKYPVSNLT